MSDVKNFLIIVNTGADKPYNQYASYVLAFVAKQVQKVENVTIVSSTMDNQDLEACVIELIGKIAFAPPEGGGTVHVVYPFKFATNP